MGAYRGTGGGSGCTSTGTCFLQLPCNICISFSLRLLLLVSPRKGLAETSCDGRARQWLRKWGVVRIWGGCLGKTRLFWSAPGWLFEQMIRVVTRPEMIGDLVGQKYDVAYQL